MTLAFLPYRIGTKRVAAGAGFGGGDFDGKAEAGRPEPVTGDDAASFYAAMLEFDWLTPEIRRAVLNALGRSQQTENVRFERGRTLAWRHMVDEVVARMRENGEQPAKGDIRTAAIEEIAEKAGIESDALRKRIQRLPVDTI